MYTRRIPYNNYHNDEALVLEGKNGFVLRALLSS